LKGGKTGKSEKSEKDGWGKIKCQGGRRFAAINVEKGGKGKGSRLIISSANLGQEGKKPEESRGRKEARNLWGSKRTRGLDRSRTEEKGEWNLNIEKKQKIYQREMVREWWLGSGGGSRSSRR